MDNNDFDINPLTWTNGTLDPSSSPKVVRPYYNPFRLSAELPARTFIQGMGHQLITRKLFPDAPNLRVISNGSINKAQYDLLRELAYKEAAKHNFKPGHYQINGKDYIDNYGGSSRSIWDRLSTTDGSIETSLGSFGLEITPEGRMKLYDTYDFNPIKNDFTRKTPYTSLRYWGGRVIPSSLPDKYKSHFDIALPSPIVYYDSSDRKWTARDADSTYRANTKLVQNITRDKKTDKSKVKLKNWVLPPYYQKRLQDTKKQALSLQKEVIEAVNWLKRKF